MKQALGFAAKTMFYAMAAVLLVLNASYTMGFVGKLFPGDWIKSWGSLILFDAGAIVWFLMFLTIAEGSGQRGTALLMGAIDLLGSLIIAGAEVFGASESFLSDPGMAAWMRQTATYILFVWLGVNIAATWLYHVTDPRQQEEMKARALQDEVTAKALHLAGAKVDAISADLADELSEDVKIKILSSLGIRNPKHLPAPGFIDVPSRDAPRHNEDGTRPGSAPAPAPRAGERRKSANILRPRPAQAPAPAAGSNGHGSEDDINPMQR